MARKAGVISIDVQAGTTKFTQDLETAKARITDFGKSGASAMAPTTAALRVFEGNLANNTRGVARFLAQTLGLGPALSAAFPIIGGIAFGAMIVDTGKKVYDFFKNLHDGPEKAKGQWADFTHTLAQSNAELELANAKLEQDINKLEGKRQNNLVIALEEARVAALNLGGQLEKDLQTMYKLFKEQDAGFLGRLFGGTDNRDLEKLIGGETSFGGLEAQLSKINQDEDAALRKVDTTVTKSNTEATIKARIKEITDDAIKAREGIVQQINAAIDPKLKEAQRLGGPHKELQYYGYQSSSQRVVDVAGDDTQKANAEVLTKAKADAAALIQHMNDVSRNTDLTLKKTDLEQKIENAKPGQIVDEKIKELTDADKAIREKMASIGQGAEATALAKAHEDAAKVIDELNKKLHELRTKLSESQEAKIKDIEKTLALDTAEEQWKAHIDQTKDALESRINTQKELQAALGQGFEATRTANVNNQLFALQQRFGETWIASHKAEVDALKQQFGEAFDAEHKTQYEQAAQALNDQINLEEKLAQVVTQGADAIHNAELAQRRILLLRTNTVEETNKLIDAEDRLWKAQREKASNQTVGVLGVETTGINALAGSVWGGKEAARLQELQNKYAVMGAQNKTDAEIEAEKAKDIAAHWLEVNQEAAKVTTEYQDQVQRLLEMKALIDAHAKAQGETLETTVARRNIEEEILRLQIKQNQELGNAKAAVRDFFTQMEIDSRNAGKILQKSLEDAMHHALDGVSNEFAKLLTGQSTDFKKLFQGIAQELIAQSIKIELEKELSKVGAKLGLKLPKSPEVEALDKNTTSLDKLTAALDRNTASRGSGAGGASAGGSDTDSEAEDTGSGSDDSTDDSSSSSGPNLGALMAAGGSAVSLGKLLAQRNYPGESNTGKDFKIAGSILGIVGNAGMAFNKGGSSDDSDQGGGFLSFLQKFGRAGGGDVDPYQTYIVGEKEPEFFTPRTPGSITPMSKAGNASFGGGDQHFYDIDARGAQIGTENRIARGIEAAHNSAVQNAVRIMHERSYRTPRRSKS